MALGTSNGPIHDERFISLHFKELLPWLLEHLDNLPLAFQFCTRANLPPSLGIK